MGWWDSSVGGALWDSGIAQWVEHYGMVMVAQWENECISLPVLSMARVMVAQWENECISLSVLPVASMAENGSISSQWYRTTCGRRREKTKSNHGQTMAEIKHRRPAVPHLLSISCSGHHSVA